MQGLQAPRRASVAAALCAALAFSTLVVLDAARRAAVAQNARHLSTALLSSGSIRGAGRRTQLWDLEEGGPTDADQGFNYNPVVLDDAVSRRGYPALVTGWREWGCDGDRESLETEWACVNHPDNHGADYDDDYFFDSYGRGGRFTGHFTENLNI